MKYFFKIIIVFVLIISVFLIINYIQNELEYSENDIEISPLPQNIKATIKLYFVKENMLSEEYRTIETNNLQFENSIIEELKEGPRNKLLKPTIPKDTKILSVKTIDNVCYVNLSKEYINNELWNEMDSSLIIWSLVNSLTELDYIHKVQILIEGEKIKVPNSNFSFEEPFLSNKELIEMKVKTPYYIIKEFLNNIRTGRSDKSYLMLSNSSLENINFDDFKFNMDKYIKKLRSYKVKYYNTQQFNDYTKVVITYTPINSSESKDEEIREEWKLIFEDEEWKILIEDKMP